MRNLRAYIVIVCWCTVVAALVLVGKKAIEVRRLQASVQEARAHNAALLNQLRNPRSQTQAMPQQEPLPQAIDNADSRPRAPASGTSELQQWLDRHPEKLIPEIGLLDDEARSAIASIPRAGSESELRLAARTLRNHARQAFGESAAQALAAYAAANQGAMPPGMSSLAPYFDPRVGESILQRYAILTRSPYFTTSSEIPLIGEISGVDDDFDSVLSISRGSLTRVSADRNGAEIQRAIHRYLQAHGGEAPPSTAELGPYLTTFVSENEISKYFINGDLKISGKK